MSASFEGELPHRAVYVRKVRDGQSGGLERGGREQFEGKMRGEGKS